MEGDIGPGVEHRVAAAIILSGDAVLLCHRHPDRRWYPDVWDVPGGHIDPGESSIEAVRREVYEELGIRIGVEHTRPFRVIDNAPDFLLDLWLVRSWTGEPANHAPDEHDEIRWVARSEVASIELSHPLLRRAIEGAMQDRRPQ